MDLYTKIYKIYESYVNNRALSIYSEYVLRGGDAGLFDSNEIAQKALLRAYELKIQKAKRAKLFIYTFMATLSGVWITASVMMVIMNNIILPLPLAPAMIDDSVPYVIDDNEIPLGLSIFPQNGRHCSLEIILVGGSEDAEESVYISGTITSGICPETIGLLRELEEGSKVTLIIRQCDDSGLPEKNIEIIVDLLIYSSEH